MAYELSLEDSIIRGDTWEGFTFTVTKNGTDYADCQIKAQFRVAPDRDLILEKSITPSNAGSGTVQFTVSLTPADTAKFNCDAVLTDIEITAASGERKTPIRIKLQVTKDITK